jgi:hypothetical protein
MVNHAAVGGNGLWHRPIGAAESSHATAAKAEFPITPRMGDDDANHHAFGGLAACIILGRVSAECIGRRWNLASEPRIDRLDGAHPETGGATLDQTKPNGEPGKPANATTGQGVAVHDDALAKDQPEVATGEDLNGPPRRFAPSKTPE